MIAMIQPIHVGNALRLFVEPPAGFDHWKVLRKAVDDFSGHDDATAVMVFEGNDRVILDDQFLTNDEPVFYRPFYSSNEGATWQPGTQSRMGTPRAILADWSTDAFVVLRDRLEAGFAVEVKKGFITANELGYVQVFSAPPSTRENLRFPLITLSLDSEVRGENAIGDYIGGEGFSDANWDWSEPEGWLARVSILISVWSINPDERIALRQALRRVLAGNMAVFSGHGIEQVDLQLSDADYLSGEFDVPMYGVNCNFSCLAPVVVAGRVPAVREVEVDAQATFPRSTHGN